MGMVILVAATSFLPETWNSMTRKKYVYGNTQVQAYLSLKNINTWN